MRKSAKENEDVMVSIDKIIFITQYRHASTHIINIHHNNAMDYKERVILTFKCWNRDGYSNSLLNLRLDCMVVFLAAQPPPIQIRKHEGGTCSGD